MAAAYEYQNDGAQLISIKSTKEIDNLDLSSEIGFQKDCNKDTILDMESAPENPRICRICHEDEGENCDNSKVLISPCNCTGSVALIHLTCLEKWLNTANTDECELCKFVYKTKRSPRTYGDYIKAQSNLGIRSLIADVICFLLLSPLLVGSTYLCALGANKYFDSDAWEAVGLILLSGFLLIVYFVWCCITVRYHFLSWKFWQQDHEMIKIDDAGINIKVQS